MAYDFEQKSIKDLTAKVSGDISVKANWSVELGDETDSTGQTYKMVLSELETLIGGGTSVFTGLTDTPSTYSGQTLKAVRVNAGETALEFFDIVHTDTNAIHDNTASEISAVTLKATPVSGDFLLIEDSADSNNKKRITIGSLPSGGGGGTSIEDTATTTGLYTEETANQIVGHSANTGTSLIFEMFEGTGTPVSVFQINGNGVLSNNGIEYYQYVASNTHIFGAGNIKSGTGNNNIFVGHAAAGNFTSGAANAVVGFQAGLNLSTGNYNAIFGNQAGYQVKAGDYNACFGAYAGYNINGSDNNTYLGAYSGHDASIKTGNVRIGYYAGKYTNTSNQLFIHNSDLTDTATELTNSMLVGTFSNTLSSQTLQANAIFTVSNDLSGDIFIVNDGSTDRFNVDNSGNSIQTGFNQSTGMIRAIDILTGGTHSITDDHFTLICNALSSAVTMNLPAITADNHGTIYNFFAYDTSNTITLNAGGSDYMGYTGTSTNVTFAAVGRASTYQADFTLGRWLKISINT